MFIFVIKGRSSRDTGRARLGFAFWVIGIFGLTKIFFLTYITVVVFCLFVWGVWKAHSSSIQYKETLPVSLESGHQETY